MPLPLTRTPLLTTRRLLLRPPEARDIPAWLARAQDREAAALAGDPPPKGPEAGAAWLARSQLRAASGEALQWCLDRQGESLGTITLSAGQSEGCAALGLVLGRAHWGQGLAGEAARAVLRFGFGALALRQVGAEVAARNHASLKLLRRLGFRPLKHFIDPADGEPCVTLALPSPLRPRP